MIIKLIRKDKTQIIEAKKITIDIMHIQEYPFDFINSITIDDDTLLIDDYRNISWLQVFEGTKMTEEREVKPLTDAEFSIFICRLEFAIWEENKEKIEKILKEVRVRYAELKKGGYYDRRKEH